MASITVNGRKVLKGSEADPNSSKFRRESGGRSVVLADGTQLNATDSKNYGRTPTVFTNTNLLEKKIPEMDSKVSQLPIYTPSNQQQNEQEEDIDSMLGLGGNKEDKWTKLRKRQSDRAAGTLDDGGDPYQDQAMELLNQMKETSDQGTRDQIALIEQQANRLRAKTASATAAGVQGVRTALLGTGAYRTGSGTAAVRSAEMAGIEQLADIDAQEREAVAAARLAQQNGDYKLLGEKLGVLETIRANKGTKADEVLGSFEQATRDNQIAELVAQGITDPIEMLQALNAGGGDFTLEEVTKAVKGLNDIRGSLPSGAFKLDNKGIGQLLGAGFTSSDITNIQADLNSGASVNDVLAGFSPEMQGTVREVLGVPQNAGGNLTPGAGAATGDDEFVIRTRMFPKFAAILNKGTLSDEDRVIIDTAITRFRDMGLTEQQAVDRLWGFPTDSPYNTGFQDALLAGSKDGEDVTFGVSKVATQLARGSYIPAMNEVENVALGRAKELAGDSYFSKAATDTYTTRIDRIKQLLKQEGVLDSVGFVEGNFNKVLGRIKGENATKVKAELTQLYNTFRKENAGVAVTDAEQRYLDNLFADINDPEGNFMAKLDVFQTGILDRYNATRSSVSLPKVRVKDILDPAERLKLYVAQPTFSGETAPQL